MCYKEVKKLKLKNMKKNLFLIFTFIILHSSAIAQVWVDGVAYPLSGTGSGGASDVGTPHFSFDSSPFLVGGWKYLSRKDGYWYLYFTGFGPINYNTYYLYARTVVAYPSVTNPPDCASWQLYYHPSGGFPWSGYPTATPTPPNGGVVSINISGTVSSAGPGTSTQIYPQYIDLSTKTSTDIASYSNYGGRLLYNICDNAMVYNNGAAWKSVWPNNQNYTVNLNQNIEFGSPNTAMFSSSTGSGINQLVLKSNNTNRIVLEKNGFQEFTQINLKGSVSVPIKTISSSYSVLDSDYTLIYNGSGGQTITLPTASDSNGRLLIVSNISASTVMTSSSVTGLGLSIAAGQNIQMISDGTNWIKIN
jgi:hypothetical protein